LFENEYRKFLQKYEIDFDEEYFLDWIIDNATLTASKHFYTIFRRSKRPTAIKNVAFSDKYETKPLCIENAEIS
jgi:cytidylate kinase